jgi:xylulokinase
MIPVVPTALGVDVGTTNVKAALVADDGTLLAGAHRPLVTHRVGDTAEQDAEAMWAQVVAAVREVSVAPVDAIGICTQYSSIVPVDARARPVAPMLMWQDQSGTDHCYEIMARDEGAFMTWVERHGIPTIGSGLSLGHILYVQRDLPEVHARTTAYLEAMDYLTARMTGRITASQHSAYMFQLCDNRALGATAYDDDLVKLSGVDPARLPVLVKVDDAIGPLLPAVAEELGISPDAVVYAGTNDTATVAVATGAFTPGRAGLSIGTTSVLVDELDEYRVDLEHQLFAMPGPFADKYVVCAENGLGGKVLEHVLEELLDLDFAELDDVIRATEPGAGGVLFLPWLNGALAPGGDDSIRGGFVHLSLDTTRRDLVRAVAEGIAHNLGWLLPHVEAFSGNRIDDIAFAGGGARSLPWCGILADVLDRRIDALASPDRAIARATALLALERHGTITRPDLDTMVQVVAEQTPDPSRHTTYAARQVQFEAAFAALRPISEALQ